MNATHPPADQVAKATASAEMDPRYGRWIWSVSFLRYYEGPLNAGGTFVDIDFFTGEVLASGDWISEPAPIPAARLRRFARDSPDYLPPAPASWSAK